jgi:hypothetical protein
MSKINVGHYEQDGGIIYLPLGFIPDFFLCVDFHTSTNIIFYYWWERMEDDQAANAQEGISVAEGVTARMGDDAGIAAYDTGSEQPPIGVWAASSGSFTARDGSTSVTKSARSATAHGTYIYGSTSGSDENGNTVDQSAIFELVTSSGNTGSSEPTWPVEIGGQVADGSNVWEKVNAATLRGGYQGVQIEDDIQTNGQEMYYLAILADKVTDHGDVDGWTNGVYGA